MVMVKKKVIKIKMAKNLRVPKKQGIKTIKMRKWSKKVAKEMMPNLKMTKRVAKIGVGVEIEIRNGRDPVRALKSQNEIEAKKSPRIKMLRRAKTKIVIAKDGVEVVIEKRIVEVEVVREVVLAVAVVAEIDEDRLEMIVEVDERNIRDHVRVVVVAAEIVAVATVEIDHVRVHALNRAQNHPN